MQLPALDLHLLLPSSSTESVGLQLRAGLYLLPDIFHFQAEIIYSDFPRFGVFGVCYFVELLPREKAAAQIFELPGFADPIAFYGDKLADSVAELFHSADRT